MAIGLAQGIVEGVNIAAASIQRKTDFDIQQQERQERREALRAQAELENARFAQATEAHKLNMQQQQQNIDKGQVELKTFQDKWFKEQSYQAMYNLKQGNIFEANRLLQDQQAQEMFRTKKVLRWEEINPEMLNGIEDPLTGEPVEYMADGYQPIIDIDGNIKIANLNQFSSLVPGYTEYEQQKQLDLIAQQQRIKAEEVNIKAQNIGVEKDLYNLEQMKSGKIPAYNKSAQQIEFEQVSDIDRRINAGEPVTAPERAIHARFLGTNPTYQSKVLNEASQGEEEVVRKLGRIGLNIDAPNFEKDLYKIKKLIGLGKNSAQMDVWRTENPRLYNQIKQAERATPIINQLDSDVASILKLYGSKLNNDDKRSLESARTTAENMSKVNVGIDPKNVGQLDAFINYLFAKEDLFDYSDAQSLEQKAATDLLTLQGMSTVRFIAGADASNKDWERIMDMVGSKDNNWQTIIRKSVTNASALKTRIKGQMSTMPSVPAKILYGDILAQIDEGVAEGGQLLAMITTNPEIKEVTNKEKGITYRVFRSPIDKQWYTVDEALVKRKKAGGAWIPRKVQ